MLLVAGAVAATITTIAKWLFVGPIRAGEHPLWSSFVWRTEVSDTFTEMVAAPWFANAASGTPALAIWLRSLGAKVGRGVWTDSYWLPEPDLVTLGDGATVNRGCVVQTHLFHDRVMSIDTVTLEAGATLGPHSVILPAASIGANATVGPGVAGDARRDSARRQQVERQPDRPVACGEGAGVPVCGRMRADPYTPQSGDPRHPASTITTSTLDYKVSTNRLSGTAVIRGRGDEPRRSTLSFDLVGPARDEGHRRRLRASRAFHQSDRKLRITLPAALAAGDAVRGHRRLRRRPAAAPLPLGDDRLGGTRRRRAGRVAAHRSPDLVPVQRRARPTRRPTGCR